MYFEESGAVNTAATVEQAVKIAKEKGLGHIVVASVTGDTALLLAEKTELKVVCVTHVYGFKEPGANQMEDSVRQRLEQKGVAVLTTTHVLSGVERGISNYKGGMYPAEIMSNTLRIFGQGLKVCVEVAIMALDAGLVPFGEDIVAIGGTGRGAEAPSAMLPVIAARVSLSPPREMALRIA